MTRGRNKAGIEGHAKRYVDQNVINEWDEEAMEELKKMKDPENKKKVEAWLAMTPEEKMKFKKQDGGKKYNKMSDDTAVEEFLELEFVADIEEELQCSGFCKPALFYWEQDIYKGVPTETCGYAVMDFFRKAAGPLKTEMRVVATTCLWLFFLHFTLYGKPKP
jgi:hypothetical protein